MYGGLNWVSHCFLNNFLGLLHVAIHCIANFIQAAGNVMSTPKGPPPYHGGVVCVSQWSIEQCWLESLTPGRATHICRTGPRMTRLSVVPWSSRLGVWAEGYCIKPCYYRNQKQRKFTLSREHCGPSSQQEEGKTIAANRDKWRDSVKALQGMYHKARRG